MKKYKLDEKLELLVMKNSLYGDSSKELQTLMKEFTKEELALKVMKKDEEIWDLIAEVDRKTADLIAYKIPPYYEDEYGEDKESKFYNESEEE